MDEPLTAPPMKPPFWLGTQGLISRSIVKDVRLVLDHVGHSWTDEQLTAAVARLRSWVGYTE